MLLNYLLIPIMGIKGAAFATLCSYVVSLICIMIVMLKKNWLYVNRKFTLMCILTCTFVIILLHEKAILSLVSAFLVITIIIVFYYKDFMAITCRLISDLKKRKIEKWILCKPLLPDLSWFENNGLRSNWEGITLIAKPRGGRWYKFY